MTGASLLLVQTLRLAAWGAYEDVSNSEDWSTLGAQVTAATARGHSAWLAAELLGRFGETDVVERLGGTLHPSARWWVSVEAGTAAQPIFMPKNTWEADVTALVTPRASAGVGYRRWNYAVGPVDIVMPHVSVQTRTIAWDARVYLSRNPSDRTDAAFTLRATTPLTRRTALWVLGGGGRESYLVGSTVRSLETVTGAAGIRYNAASGVTLRVGATVIGSTPVLARRGLSVGIEK
jgi:YaiO family outer membrane protein